MVRFDPPPPGGGIDSPLRTARGTHRLWLNLADGPAWLRVCQPDWDWRDEDDGVASVSYGAFAPVILAAAHIAPDGLPAFGLLKFAVGDAALHRFWQAILG